jgi:very-short-patch-repair endonuclease
MQDSQPSPLAGEGGAPEGAPGEGKTKRKTRRVSEKVAFARQLRKAPTDAEDILWQILRTEFRAAKFRRQVPVGPYVADFLSYSARLVIEVDGPIHDPAKDARRDAWFAANRWRVLRFGNRTVLTDLLKVKSSISFAVTVHR